MGRDIAFETPLGSIGGWRADPVGRPARRAGGGPGDLRRQCAHPQRGRPVCGRRGFIALAPAFFDPVERDVELGYDEAGVATAASWSTALGFDARRRRSSPPRRSCCSDEGLQGRRGRLLLGRHRRAPGQHAPRPAGGELLRRAQRRRSSTSRCARRCSSTSASSDSSIPAHGHRAASREASRRRGLRLSGRPRLQSRRRSEGLRRGERAARASRTLEFFDAALRLITSRRAAMSHRNRHRSATNCIRNWPPTPIRSRAFELCDLRLMDDANYPWLVLVPRLAGRARTGRPRPGATPRADRRDRSRQRARCAMRSSRTSSTSPRSATWCRNCTCT